MNFLRSALFLLYMTISVPLVVFYLLLNFWQSPRRRRQLVEPWVRATLWTIKHVLGIDWRVEGRENIPDRPCVILSKHQSALETFALQEIFADTVYVYKRELHWLPFFGWGLRLMPFIAIDRAAGKAALAEVAQKGSDRLREGYSVIIFPEGTRVAPGERKRYKIGGAYLAVAAQAPVVPIALDSGEYWPKRAFLKRPGTVTIRIGPPIDPAGKTPEAVMAEVEGWIEAEMRKIAPHRDRHAAAESP
ncbi:MAG: 1-acyl-sn-glycerol-3-phosphate acyltransferase [Rhodocyclaceae bacterium]|nr:1-acyl-sn-glycerol-3-phosphate acyltransferase [Rhodocyclaceae bacterium]